MTNYYGILDNANYECRHCAEDGVCDLELGVFDEDPTAMDEEGCCTDNAFEDCDEFELEN